MNPYGPNRQNSCINPPKSNYDLAFDEAQFLFATRINSVFLQETIQKGLLAMTELEYNGYTRLEYTCVLLRDYIEVIKSIHPLVKTEMSSLHYSFIEILQEHLSPHLELHHDSIDTIIKEIQNINNVNPHSYHS